VATGQVRPRRRRASRHAARSSTSAASHRPHPSERSRQRAAREGRHDKVEGAGRPPPPVRDDPLTWEEALAVSGWRRTRTSSAVEQAFHRLALTCHPDKSRTSIRLSSFARERKFRRLQAAREIAAGAVSVDATQAEGLRVEALPRVRRRYNVTRLAPGTRFSCRRCAESSPSAPRSRRPRSQRARSARGGARLALLVAVSCSSRAPRCERSPGVFRGRSRPGVVERGRRAARPRPGIGSGEPERRRGAGRVRSAGTARSRPQPAP